jgi:hypothetical protein
MCGAGVAESGKGGNRLLSKTRFLYKHTSSFRLLFIYRKKALKKGLKEIFLLKLNEYISRIFKHNYHKTV